MNLEDFLRRFCRKKLFYESVPPGSSSRNVSGTARCSSPSVAVSSAAKCRSSRR